MARAPARAAAALLCLACALLLAPAPARAAVVDEEDVFYPFAASLTSPGAAGAEKLDAGTDAFASVFAVIALPEIYPKSEFSRVLGRPVEAENVLGTKQPTNRSPITDESQTSGTTPTPSSRPRSRRSRPRPCASRCSASTARTAAPASRRASYF